MNGLAVGEGLAPPANRRDITRRKTGGETPPLQNKHHFNIVLTANNLQTNAYHKITSVGRPILSVQKLVSFGNAFAREVTSQARQRKNSPPPKNVLRFMWRALC